MYVQIYIYIYLMHIGILSWYTHSLVTKKGRVAAQIVQTVEPGACWQKEYASLMPEQNRPTYSPISAVSANWEPFIVHNVYYMDIEIEIYIDVGMDGIDI